MRIYDKNIKPKGSIDFYSNNQGFKIQFSINSKYFIELKEIIKEFLKKNNLKIVSNQDSFRAHKNHRNHTKTRSDFDIFIRFRNPRTQEIELKSITQTPNSASQVSKADEHNIILKDNSNELSQISSNDETSLNNNIQRNLRGLLQSN